MAEPLFTMSDADIRAAATRKAEHVQYSYSDYLSELDRRSNRGLTTAIAASTTLYAFLTALLILITAVKP